MKNNAIEIIIDFNKKFSNSKLKKLFFIFLFKGWISGTLIILLFFFQIIRLICKKNGLVFVEYYTLSLNKEVFVFGVLIINLFFIFFKIKKWLDDFFVWEEKISSSNSSVYASCFWSNNLLFKIFVPPPIHYKQLITFRLLASNILIIHHLLNNRFRTLLIIFPELLIMLILIFLNWPVKSIWYIVFLLLFCTYLFVIKINFIRSIFADMNNFGPFFRGVVVVHDYKINNKPITHLIINNRVCELTSFWEENLLDILKTFVK